MTNSLTQTKGGQLLHKAGARFLDGLELTILLIFAGVSIFPAQTLAFNTKLGISGSSLEFQRDPALEGMAVVGIDEWPQARTFERVLRAEPFQVRSSLAEGSAVRVLVTAYSSTVDQTDGNPFITASGAIVGQGIMAANFLPLGSKVKLDGKIYIIQDRMNERFNNKYVVDIWKPSRQEALAHGVRAQEMTVVFLP